MKNLDDHDFISLLTDGKVHTCNEINSRSEIERIHQILIRNTTSNELSNLTSDKPYEGCISWEKVHAVLIRLPRKQRVVIVLFYINNLPIQEISDILKIPPGTVKSRLHYGRKMMKNSLEQIEHR